MRLIEIEPLSNGGHRNQTITRLSSIPEGWAVVPEDMEIPDTFPFVNIEVENGILTAMTAGVVPEVEPTPEPVHEPTAQDDTDAMLVDHEYRLTLLELEV